MIQQYSQCDLPEHPDEYIVGLCFDNQCQQKPEYCFLCKTEGKHINHQKKQCYSFYNLKKKISETKNMLVREREQLLKSFQNVSLCLSDVLYQSYQKKLDECQLLIQISKDENVEESRHRIDLFQYYLNLNLEELRIFIDKVEQICNKFNDEMKEVMDKFEFPIIYKNSVVESQNSMIQIDTKILNYNPQEFSNSNSQQKNIEQDNDHVQKQKNQQVDEINDDDEFFKLQMQMILESEQNLNIQESLKLTNETKQNLENPQAIQIIDEAIQLYENNEEALQLKGVILVFML